ncbi:MAG: ATP-binding cassette domain-containing protein, partial [Clostridia bacterium]|nr:ATP-binding cassette domain-containing protein [Clostridia bacterium]
MEKNTEKNINEKKPAKDRQKNKQLRKEKRDLVLEAGRGTFRHFITGIIGIVFANLSAYCIPLITSFTIDYVLLDYAEADYQGGMTVAPWVERILASVGGKAFLTKHLYIMGIILILMTTVNAVSIYLRRSEVAKGSEIFAYNLRTRLYDHLENVPYDYHKHIISGDIIQRCTSDLDTIRRFVQSQLLEIVRTVVMVLIAATIMFSLNTKLALCSVIMMPFLSVASYVYGRKAKHYFTESDEAEGALSAAIQENAAGMRVVRAFGQQRSELDSFTEKNRDYREKATRLNNVMAYFWGVSDAFGYIQIGISLCLSIVMVIKKQISVGELLVFSSYTSMLVWPVRQLGRILADLEKAGVSLGRINEILKVPVESEPGRALEPEIKGSVEFKNVGFGYEDGQEVLTDISFTAKPGETVAILGSTGSGKSSLVQLLQRLYTV